MLRSRIEAAERRLGRARLDVKANASALGDAVHGRLRSPQAHLVALTAGFVWGLRPECRDVDTRGSTRVKKAVGITARAALTRFMTGLIA